MCLSESKKTSRGAQRCLVERNVERITPDHQERKENVLGWRIVSVSGGRMEAFLCSRTGDEQG